MTDTDDPTERLVFADLHELTTFRELFTVDELLRRHDCLLELMLEVSDRVEEHFIYRCQFKMILDAYKNYDMLCLKAGVNKSTVEDFNKRRRNSHLHPSFPTTSPN